MTFSRSPYTVREYTGYCTGLVGRTTHWHAYGITRHLGCYPTRAAAMDAVQAILKAALEAEEAKP